MSSAARRLAVVAWLAGLALPSAALAGVHTVATTYPVSAESSLLALHVRAGDFNGDHRVDLATSDLAMSGGDATVLFGRGDGTFADGDIYATDPRPGSIAVGDFDEDGNDDMVLPSDTANSLTLLYGNRDSTFDGDGIALGLSSNSVAVGRFNADAHLDIAAATPGQVLILLGDGDGGFAAPAPYATGGGGYGLIAAGDLDGDGRDDIVAAPGFGASFAVLLSNADGTLQAPKPAPPPGSISNGLTVARLNADARADVVLSPSAALSLTGADGTPGAAAPVLAGGRFSVAAGDLNADGKADLALSAPSTSFGSVKLLAGHGDGTFDAPITLPTPDHTGVEVATDLNGDGFGDLVLTDVREETVIVGINAPFVKADHDGLGFGSVIVGAASAAKTLTLSNDGRPPLVLGRVALAGANPGDFRIASDGCSGRTLPADGTCQVAVASAPGGGGARTAELVVSSNAPVARFPLTGGGVVPSPGPSLDRQAPVVTLAIAARRLGAVLTRGFAVTLRCSEACTLDVQIRKGSKVLARAKLRLAAAQSRRVTLKLAKGARRLLGRRTRLTLRVRARDASGNVGTTTRAFTLRR